MNQFSNKCERCGKKHFEKRDITVMMEMNLCSSCFQEMLKSRPVMDFDTKETYYEQ